MDIVSKRCRTLESGPGNQGLMHNKDGDSDGIENVPGNRGPVRNNGGGFDGIDHISNLPNEILCHILSFLPTKDAVGTGMLSTRWKNLLPLVPNLNIDVLDSSFIDPDSVSETSVINFKNFVDKLLNITLHSVPFPPSLDSLCIDCEIYNDGQDIAKWVDAAINLKPKKMKLDICQLRNPDFLLASLFGSNLITLSLSLDFADEPSEYTFSLPNLEVLMVMSMTSNVVNALLDGCPSLRRFILSCCYCDPGSVLRICTPSLRYLKLCNEENSLKGELKLDAPKLEFLWYEGFLPNQLSAKWLESLDVAELDLDSTFGGRPFRISKQEVALIKACSNAEILSGSRKLVKMLYLHPQPLPKFPRLMILEIPQMYPHVWRFLLPLLNSAPNFVNLSVESEFDYELYVPFKRLTSKSLNVVLRQQGETGANLLFCRKGDYQVQI